MHTLEKHFSARSRFLCCFALLFSAIAQGTPEMPKTEGESLAGNKVVLPDAAAGKVAVLVFGFTKASKTPTSAWAAKLRADFETRPGFELYQLPVLEDVPRLIRGMVISGMKKGMAENKQDHFVPILQGEAELKKFVHYSQADDAYLVVLGRAGNVLEQTHGALEDANEDANEDASDDASYARFRTDIESALSKK
jgi:hypothetical protein